MPTTPRAIRCRSRRTTSRALATRALAPRAFGLVLMTAAAGACARRPAADTGLNTDVALAEQLHPQPVPALGAALEPGRAQRPDSFRDVVRPTARATASLVRTRVITRTVTVAPVQREASIVGREHRDASAGEVVAAAPVERRSTDAGATTYGSPVSANAVPASTTDAGGYRPSTTNSGAYGAGTYESAGSAPGATDGEYGASAPVYRQPQAHAARDGAFGSVAGAILGAAVGGHNRVRGGLIGAVAGGALGAIYGGSVDRTGPMYGSSGRGTRAVRSY